MNVHAVLLVPEDGDPLGLLSGGPCGAGAPVVPEWQCTNGCEGTWWCSPQSPAINRHRHRRTAEHFQYPHCLRHALVLAWDGKPVVEGMDRAHRSRFPAEATTEVLGAQWPAYMQDAIALAGICEREGMGRRVMLDAKGNTPDAS